MHALAECVLRLLVPQERHHPQFGHDDWLRTRRTLALSPPTQLHTRVAAVRDAAARPTERVACMRWQNAFWGCSSLYYCLRGNPEIGPQAFGWTKGQSCPPSPPSTCTDFFPTCPAFKAWCKLPGWEALMTKWCGCTCA